MKELNNSTRPSEDHSLRRNYEDHLAQTFQLPGRQAQIRNRISQGLPDDW